MSSIVTQELAVRTAISGIANPDTLMIKTSATNLRTYEQLNIGSGLILSGNAGNKTLSVSSYISNTSINIYPEDYGAVGVSGIDDSNAFNSMFAVLSAMTYPTTIILSKIYYVGTSGWNGFLINNNNIHMQGMGWNTGFKLLAIPTYTTSDMPYESVFHFGNDSVGVSGTIINNFSINLNNIECTALYFRKCYNTIIDHIEIFNSPNQDNGSGDGRHGVGGWSWPCLILSDGTKSKIENCYLHDVSSSVLLGDSGPADLTGFISDLIFEKNHIYNIYATGACSFSDSIIQNNIWDGGSKSGTGTYGSTIAGLEFSTRVSAQNIVFKHNIWRNFSGVALQISPYYTTSSVKNIIIDGEKFYYMRDSALYNFGGMTHLTITNCECWDNGHYDIYIGAAIMQDASIRGPKYFNITNNKCYVTNVSAYPNSIGGIFVAGNGLVSNCISDGLIQGNYCYNHSYYGIAIYAENSDYDNSNFIIKDNILIRDRGGIESYGILTTSQIINVEIFNNLITGYISSVRSSARSSYVRIFFNTLDTITYPDDTNYNSTTKPWMWGNRGYNSQTRQFFGGTFLDRLAIQESQLTTSAGEVNVNCIFGNYFMVNLTGDVDITVNNPINYEPVNADAVEQITLKFYRNANYPSTPNITFGSNYILKEPFSCPSYRRIKSITFTQDLTYGWVETARTEYDMGGIQLYEGKRRIEKDLYFEDLNLSTNQIFLYTIPKGSVVESILANVDSTISVSLPTPVVPPLPPSVSASLGQADGGWGEYGTIAFSQNSKINVVENSLPLENDYNLYLNAIDTSGSLATGKFIGGKFRLKIIYWTNYAMDNANIGPQTYVWTPGVVSASDSAYLTVTYSGIISGDVIIETTFDQLPSSHWTCSGTIVSADTILTTLYNGSSSATDVPTGNLYINCYKNITSAQNIPIISKRTGFAPPLLTTEEAEQLIGGVVIGLGSIIYDMTINKLKFFNGSAWETITSSI